MRGGRTGKLGVSLVLSVRDLVTAFDTDNGRVRAVDGVSFDVAQGRTLGIVGESGCGKSVTAHSIMRLLPQPQGRILGGSITFEGRDLVGVPVEEMRKVRGGRIGMVFQEPLSALNPVHTIGRQLSEVFLIHRTTDSRQALQWSVELLGKVGIPSPEIRVGEYPHQLSGGMRQRVVIAMAIACKPALLIADEPTTALDVTIQAQILELLRDLQREMGMATILITHDLGVIAENCDDVLVMYAGKVAEQGSVNQIFSNPSHPYTRGLLSSIPRLEHAHKTRLRTIEGLVPALDQMPVGCRFQNRCAFVVEQCRASQPPLEEVAPGHFAACYRWREVSAGPEWTPATQRVEAQSVESPGVESRRAEGQIVESPGVTPRVDPGAAALGVAAAEIGTSTTSTAPLLEVRNLKMYFPVREGLLLRTRRYAAAVDSVSLEMRQGETLGVVGESGCGKTTLAKCIIRLLDPTDGEVLFEGTDIAPLSRRRLKPFRRQVQMVFQDPVDSLNSRHTVSQILEEPFVIHGIGTASERKHRVRELLDQVGMPADSESRYPFEFSGGQRQRIGIARAISLSPRLVICDEPVSALDVSIQSQVLNLLLDLQRELGLSYLFIAHNLAVVKHVSDRIAVMYLGRIVEEADAEELYRRPCHPYTQALISAIPVPDPTHERKRVVLEGDLPSPITPPPGCHFHPRCPFATDRCKTESPALRVVGERHRVSCHYDLG